MSDSGVEQENRSDATVEALKKKGKPRKGRPRKAVVQASEIPTSCQQFTPPRPVQAPSQTVPQGAQTVVQPLQTLYQPLQAVLHPQHTILPPSQAMPQPPQSIPQPPNLLHPQQPPPLLLQPTQTVLQPPQAILQPPQTVLQHPSLAPQPPKPGYSESNPPPPSSLVQFTAFPNTFSSPMLNGALQAPVQQAVPTSVANTSQTSTMSLLNALHDEKLGLLIPVIVRMEHKMDQLMAMMGQMGSQLNSIIMGNQSNVSLSGGRSNTVVMGSQSSASVMRNQSNAATVENQSNAAIRLGNQSNATVIGNQSNVATTGSQSDGTTPGNQPNTAIIGSQSNATVARTQSSTTLTINNPVSIPLESNNDVDQTTSNARQSSPAPIETQSISSTDGTQLNVPNNEISNTLNESATQIQTRSQRNKDQRNTEQVVTGNSNLPAFYLSKEYLISLKRKSNSVKNFAVRLMRELFTKEELDGKNISGSRGKDQVDPERIKMIKEIVFKMYNTLPEDRDIEWRNCRKAMDSFLRSKKHKQELGEQRAEQNAELLKSFSLDTLNSEQSDE